MVYGDEIMRSSFFDLSIALISGLFVCLILFPLIALFTTTSLSELAAQLLSAHVVSAVLISFSNLGDRRPSLSLVWNTRRLPSGDERFKGKIILDTLIDLPVTIPPLVSGLALLMLLGGNNPFGSYWPQAEWNLFFQNRALSSRNFLWRRRF